MRIIDMVNANFQSAKQSAEQSKQGGLDFKLVFNEAERRQPVETVTENRNRDDNRGRKQSNETRKEQPVRRRENTKPAEDITSAAGTAAIYEQAVVSEANTETEVNAEQVIEKVAEIMEVSVEVIAEMLEELGLTAEDLIDPQAVTQMLQLALDAETPAELLTNPDFPELYKAINEAIAELEVAAPAVVAESNVKAVVKTDDDAKNETVTELSDLDLDGLEATVEDGQLVITDGKENNISDNNVRTQTAVQSTTHTEVDEITPLTEDKADLAEADIAMLKADEPILDESQNTATAFSIEQTAINTEQVVRQATTQQPVNAANVIEQIMNQVQVSSAGGQFSEIRVTLRPESLGDIVLRVLTQNGIVTAQFEAENQRVKETLEANFNQLRDALSEQGIKFSELSVSVRQDENERMNQFEHARQNSRHRAESIETVSEETQKEVSYHNGVIDLTA